MGSPAVVGSASPADRSVISRVGLPLITWGLAVHVAAIALLFGALGMAVTTVRAIATWKEVAVIVLLVLAAMRAVSGRGPRATVSATDIWVGGLIALATVFLLAGSSWFLIDVPGEATLQGFRDSVYYLLLYFVGRATPEIAKDPRTLKRLYLIAVMVAAVGIVEWIFVTPEQLVLLGVASYFQDFLGVAAFTIGNDFGLPTSYWVRIGGREVQRVGSIFLSGQGMAVPFLLLLPAASGWLVANTRRSWRSWLGYAVICAGLLLTLTRMTVVACAFGIAVFLLLMRKPMPLVAFLAAAAAAFAVATIAVPGFGGFVWETLTWQTGSSRTHLEDWARGYIAMFEHPLGAGLGTTDMAAVRAGIRPLAIDNQYLEYGVGLGFPGLALHLLIFSGIVFAALRVMRTAADRHAQIHGAVMVAATAAIMVNALTAGVFNSLFLAYVYFWLAGALVTVAYETPDQSHGLRVPPQFRAATAD